MEKIVGGVGDIVINADCFDVLPRIESGTVDMILTDLPYGTTNRNKWDVILPFDKMWAEYERVIKDDGAIVLFAGQPFTSLLIASNLELFKYVWIWKKSRKTNFLNAKKQPLRQHEDVVVFYKRQPKYHPPDVIRIDKRVKQGDKNTNNYGLVSFAPEYVQEFGNYPSDILEFQNPSKYIHPTQKPLPLLEYLIKTYTDEGETVLDTCAGSLSTCLAAKNTGRRYIGIEKDKGYFDKGVETL